MVYSRTKTRSRRGNAQNPLVFRDTKRLPYPDQIISKVGDCSQG